MLLLLLSIAVLLLSGAAALAVRRNAGLACRIGAGGAVLGCALGMIPAVAVLRGTPVAALRLAWSVPYGAFFVGADGLSAFFLIVLYLLGAVSAVYGAEYLRHYGEGHRLGAPWLFFNCLIASIVLVLVARNAVLFLIAWELMALSSFFFWSPSRTTRRVCARRAGRIWSPPTSARRFCWSCSSCSGTPAVHSISIVSSPRNPAGCSCSP